MADPERPRAGKSCRKQREESREGTRSRLVAGRIEIDLDQSQPRPIFRSHKIADADGSERERNRRLALERDSRRSNRAAWRADQEQARSHAAVSAGRGQNHRTATETGRARPDIWRRRWTI